MLVIGQAAWPRHEAASAQPWGQTDQRISPAVERRALLRYRAILGGQGAERRREDGTLVRRALPERVRERLATESERRLRAEVLVHRVRHFSKGMILGSRAFIDGWFTQNREQSGHFRGKSRTEREHGAQSLGLPALRGLYALRNPQT